ncbi:uncharacterized protein BJ171DRAFT_595979 [Polychytrium aggregatum]|uniref:uncharacterized protein n=1 Tax=Polychytrium aggregatum TaxID=110093 RepID=UPI0022FF1D06|nr:uncharacterized protein BJ171DRAFT_595979 [Polychytrium aggregatum]KAI9208172.1 hypothetical protein BJ171DRAFT_595979 [Polychytrium aggregatum]
MKVLVTGGAGFIGSHTAEALLARGDSVVVVDELNDYYDLSQKMANIDILKAKAAETGSQFQFFQADCADMTSMTTIFELERPDVVCHLAARAGVRPSIKDPHIYVHSNIQATVTMLEMARQFGVSNFVYASSSSVYGANTKIPFAEDDTTENTVSPYAATKKACEIMAKTYHSLYKINVTGLRFFTVYGPRGRPDMAPWMFVEKISSGSPINKYGDGSSCRDYTYIDDIVSGVLASIDKPHPCEVFNLGNSQTINLNGFIEVIEDVVGKKALIKQLPDQPGDVPLTYADLTKSSRMLGYRPQTSLREGMSKFVEWYRHFRVQSQVQSRPATSTTLALNSSLLSSHHTLNFGILKRSEPEPLTPPISPRSKKLRFESANETEAHPHDGLFAPPLA